jgi:hypothetical protein
MSVRWRPELIDRVIASAYSAGVGADAAYLANKVTSRNGERRNAENHVTARRGTDRPD